ncbi:TetR/AcrR family transcriptional regulator [Planctomycetota bacterium]|nr:TetR/AcrR family transcriptional regulator [Planctomycetota bacterium]
MSQVSVKTNSDGLMSKAEMTRAGILDAAEGLFAEKGFSATAMSEVAKVSETSKPLIHHHFGTKRELYLAVRERLIGKLPEFEVGEPAEVENEVEGLIANGLKTLTEFLRVNGRLIRLMAWARLEGDEEMWPGQELVFAMAAERLKIAQDEGLIRKDIPAASLMVMMGGMVYFYNEHKDGYREMMRGLGGENGNAGDGGDDTAFDEKYLGDMIRLMTDGAGA